MNINLLNSISIAALLSITALSQTVHADSLTYQSTSSIQTQNQIEATNKLIDSIGFVDVNAQSKFYLETSEDTSRLEMLNTTPVEKPASTIPGVISFK